MLLYKVFQIGDFTIKPYLMDHSGFDSYAFLIKAEGKGIFLLEVIFVVMAENGMNGVINTTTTSTYDLLY